MPSKEPLLRVQFDGIWEGYPGKLVWVSGVVAGRIGFYLRWDAPSSTLRWVPRFEKRDDSSPIASLEGMHSSFESFRGKAYRLLRRGS